MACDLKISKHHSGSWAVLDTGLFYPNEIFVEVKHCGIKLGEWTLDEIVAGFKKSLKEKEDYPIRHHTHITLTENELNNCQHIQSHEKIKTEVDRIWKATTQSDDKINGQVVKIISLEEKIKDLEKKYYDLRIDHDDLHGAVKNDITNLIDQNKELENKITKVDEMRRSDWKYTQEKTSFDHSEVIRLNAWIERLTCS